MLYRWTHGCEVVEERGGEEVVVVAGGRITAGKPTHPFTHLYKSMDLRGL